ncbi:MAG: uroporphyrinogen decarboxylase family protein [Sporomusaceae bacterium]|nr:uroporphyrinogen decarboxylase family protein [Sporomusaceae bacterium]
MLTKTERLRLALSGEATDRIPYSLWTHFPGIDLDADKLADTTYDFYRKLNLDFVKNMSNGMFSIEDWGCVCDYSEIANGGVAKVTRFGVNEPGDWARLQPLDVTQGALGRELRSLRRLLASLNGEAPVLATVFSPLTTAQKLSGSKVVAHMRTDPELVKAGLEVIAESTLRFAQQAMELGCAGVYFASQMSCYDAVSEADYAEFGVPYDLAVLQPLQQSGWLHVMHIHGNNIMFPLLKQYPVQGISWHVGETAPTVADFLAATDKCIVGGLQRFHITDGKLTELAEEAADMIKITGGKRLLLAPGCVIRAPFDWQTLFYIRDLVTAAGPVK